jgi:hypothetical protein
MKTNLVVMVTGASESPNFLAMLHCQQKIIPDISNVCGANIFFRGLPGLEP